METNGNKKWFKEEMKFIIIIIGFVASALFNWFSTKSDIALIKYRVDKIEEARAEVWVTQRKINDEQYAAIRTLNTEINNMIRNKKP